MASVKEHPEALQPYLAHGLELEYRDGATNAQGNCPWCGREGKFSVRVETGQWRCWVCNEGKESKKSKNGNRGGNARVFIQMLWERSNFVPTPYEQYEALARDRRLWDAGTLQEWGVRRSMLTGEWIMPGYNATGKIVQLYRYAEQRDRKVLLATPTLGHGLFGVPLYEPSKEGVYLCEGPWDAMALWEVARSSKIIDGGLAMTGNAASCLLAEASVLAVPGCTTFHESWLPLFEGKRVRVLYDNDHPRKHPTTGADVAPAGFSMTQRVAKILRGTAADLDWLRWGEPGWDTARPSGCDVRDVLTAEEEVAHA